MNIYGASLACEESSFVLGQESLHPQSRMVIYRRKRYVPAQNVASILDGRKTEAA